MADNGVQFTKSRFPWQNRLDLRILRDKHSWIARAPAFEFPIDRKVRHAIDRVEDFEH